MCSAISVIFPQFLQLSALRRPIRAVFCCKLPPPLEERLAMTRPVTRLWILALLLSAIACDSTDIQSDPAGPTSLGANGLKLSGIGDSIMQGFDAGSCDLPICFDQPEYSFAQGTSADVESLYLRFDEPGIEFVSVTGARMIGGSSNAQTQATRICQQKTRPNRIVILLGANDICNATSAATVPAVEDFAGALNDALSTLTAESCGLAPGSAIHVMSVPRLDLLYTSGLAKSGVDCVGTWTKFGICPLATTSPTAETIQGIVSAVEAYNQAILDTVTELQASTDATRELTFTTDYVGTTPNSSFGTYEFIPDDLSNLDCFHPSIQGQRKLACMAWESWQGDRVLTDCME